MRKTNLLKTDLAFNIVKFSRFSSLILFAIAALVISGCTKKTEIGQNKKISKTSEARCPNGIGALEGDPPKLFVEAKNGIQLILCGYSTESEFEVYSVDNKGVVSKALVTYGANDYVKTTAIPNGIKIEELIVMGDATTKSVPAFEQKIECSEICKVSEPACVYKKPAQVIKFNSDEIKSYQIGKKRYQVPFESVLANASDSALTGDIKAQEFFLKQRKSIKLDGASAELFDATEKILTKMKSAKCL